MRGVARTGEAYVHKSCKSNPAVAVFLGCRPGILDVSTNLVYTIPMVKKITLTADEALIQQARRRAVLERITLNDLFRAWLGRYVTQPSALEQYEALMARLDHIRSDRKYGREEMHERR